LPNKFNFELLKIRIITFQKGDITKMAKEVKTKILYVRLPTELAEKMEDYCAQKKIAIQDFLTAAVLEKLEIWKE
jgi:hypothetical protein